MGTEKNSCKTAAVMSLLGKGPAVERDVQVLSEQPRDIETITREILDAKRVGGEAIITIGRGLMEAKALLSHGEWLPWLADKVEFSEKAAQRFMLLARKYSNPTALSDLGATKALMLLAIPDEARDEFISTPHEVNGEEKTVIDMTSRELEAAIKERDEALKAAEQAQANEQVAVDAREKISQDMKLANERIAGLNAEVAEHSAKAKEAQDTAARLEKELAELRAKPVEVAVEADPAAIEAAREEAKEFMQVELDEAQKGWAEAVEAKEAAEAARADAQKKLDELQAELDGLRFEAERAEKKAALNSDADLILFDELLSQSQTIANRMNGVIMKKQGKDPGTAEKLRAATLALSNVYREVAQG